MRVWNRPAAATLIGILVSFGLNSTATSQGDPVGGSGMAILNNDTQLRAFMVFRTPMVVSPDGVTYKPVVATATPRKK